MKNKQKLQQDKAIAFSFIQKINFILAKIREANVGIMETKPSDDPNKKAVTKVLFPPEGGVLTYYENAEYPTKGFCYGETVETVDEVKKTLMEFLYGFFDNLAKSKIKTLLFILFFRNQFGIFLKRVVNQLNNRMRRVRQKPQMYCRCAREIYRVSNLMAIWYPAHKAEIESVRNIGCMVLEYDDAYRYPFQDIVPEFNDESGRKDIVNELRRLLTLTIERDNRGTAGRFGMIRRVLFLLRFNKNLKEALRRFFLELNLDEIRMDEADRFHAHFKPGYNWDNKNNEKEKEKEILK